MEEITAKVESLKTVELDPMIEFDQLRRDENKVGEKLDQQLLQTLQDWGEWAEGFEWVKHEDPEDPNSRISYIDYKIQSTTQEGEPIILTIDMQDGRLKIWEADSQNNLISITQIVGEISKDADMKSVKRSAVGYSVKDDSGGRDRLNNVDSLRGASTAYGYVIRAGSGRARFFNPGMEDLGNPMILARSTLDKLKSGTVTHTRGEPGQDPNQWIPINTSLNKK